MAILIAVLLLPLQIYREGDWVTYSEFRRISSISYDLRYVYFGSSGGIARYDKLFEQWDEPISAPENRTVGETVVCGYDRYEDCLWIVTALGLVRYNPSLLTWERFPDVGEWAGVHSIGIGEEAVWFVSEGYALRLRREDGEWQHTQPPPSGIQWWGRKSLAALDSSRYAFLSPYYIRDSNLVRYEITAIARDDGDLWVGTGGYGVFRYDPLTFQGEHLLYGLAKRRVDCVVNDGDSLWIGGMEDESNGITLWDRRNGKFAYFETPYTRGLRSQRVHDISAAGDLIAFGTDEGVSLYDKKEREWRTYTIFDGLPSDEVISVERDSSYLFCGTDLGLSILHTDTREVAFAPQLSNLRINDILGTKDTTLFATDHGVFFIDKRENAWKQLADPEQSLAFGTTRLALDGSGFWFGTYDGVVHFTRRTGEWERWSVGGHYYIGHVVALAADSVNVWVGTRWGVLKFSKRDRRWRAFSTEDGLPDSLVFTILPEGDYVWLGGSRGVTRFYWNSPLARD